MEHTLNRFSLESRAERALKEALHRLEKSANPLRIAGRLASQN